MKISPNAPCPCGSREKYKKCCQKYHKGTLAPNALLLMKSRYCAFAVGEVRYIIKTTHPSNSDYRSDTREWQEEIESFCKNSDFLNLDILAFLDGEYEAYVSFVALLSSGELKEKSRFLKEEGKWLYVDGEFN